MVFRPYPVLSLFAAAIFAACIALGVWQLQRTAWKRGLIADFEKTAAAPPLDIEEALCGGGDPVGRVVAAEGVIHGPPSVGNDLRMYGQDELGQAGWKHLSAVGPPACMADEGALIVETGFEPFQPDPSAGEGLAVAQALPARLVVTAWPQKPPFAAANTPDENDWHWFDGPAMGDRLGAPLNTSVYLAVFSGRTPERLVRTPPATHIGYAATWFGMAAALVLIYGAFHARAGRLRFSSGKKPPP